MAAIGTDVPSGGAGDPTHPLQIVNEMGQTSLPMTHAKFKDIVRGTRPMKACRARNQPRQGELTTRVAPRPGSVSK